jgi:hypothetical protein
MSYAPAFRPTLEEAHKLEAGAAEPLAGVS